MPRPIKTPFSSHVTVASLWVLLISIFFSSGRKVHKMCKYVYKSSFNHKEFSSTTKQWTPMLSVEELADFVSGKLNMAEFEGCLKTADPGDRTYKTFQLIQKFDALEGVPSIRTVVLVGEPTDGFVFFSHYDSLKGRQLAENPVASGSFYWPHTRPTDRQIIFTGNVTRLSPEESDIYWNSVSTTYKLLNYFKQGQIVRGNEVMESMRAASESDHPDGMMPRPATWGGFIIRPYVIEFSQGRTGRRDRFVFKKLRPDEIFDVVTMETGTDGWVIYRILP